jgi:glycosyltransferase involved in cell wall biosynthesis
MVKGVIKMKISVIVPAYNEEDRIETALLNYANSFPDEEIIVVCDGTDNTKNIIREKSKKYPNIKLLHFEKKLGKGGGIIEGFKAAKGERIGFVDADESVEPDEVKKMFDLLSDYDGVIASRKLNGSKILVRPPLKRRIASGTFNSLIRIIFGLDFKDTQCGAKVFRKEAVKDILSELTTKGFEFDVELLWRLKNKGYEVMEFPITWKHSEGSSFSLSNAPKMFFSLLKVRLWK